MMVMRDNNGNGNRDNNDGGNDKMVMIMMLIMIDRLADKDSDDVDGNDEGG